MRLTNFQVWFILICLAFFSLMALMALLPHSKEVSDMDQVKSMCQGKVDSFTYRYEAMDGREIPVAKCK